MFTPLNLTDLVRRQVASIQALANSAQDFAIGSILRAIVQSNNSLALLLQGFILQVLAATRAATCKGEDLDSWMADYGLSRQSAVYATGRVTFSRFTPGLVALIPVGSTVETTDGSQKYVVVADSSDPNYDNLQGGYVVPAGSASIDVPVQANLVGVGGNAQIGGINVLTSSIVGVDTVYNEAAFINGQDAELDDTFRSRFALFIQSLSKGTKAAILYAVASVQAGLTCSPVENYDHSGAWKPGYFFVVVDDGTGTPPQFLLDKVYDAIEAVRAFTITFNVFAPDLVTVDAGLTVSVNPNYDATSVKAAVQEAITNYLNNNKLGVSTYFYKIPQIAFEAHPGVVNVSNVTMDGGTDDVIITNVQKTKAGTVTVN